MWWNNILVHFVLTSLVCWMGWQDWKTREVPNALTLPFALAGMVGLLHRFMANDPSAVLSLFVFGLLTVAALRSWMGGADWKVLIGLWGVWTRGGLAALLAAGLWGVVETLRSHDKNVSFPGIAAFSAGLLLTFLVEISIIRGVGVILPGRIAPFFI
jgi:Flp pilus assembly protein protease CpaA